MSSYYSRHEAGGTVSFEIVPAPYPGSGQALFMLIAGIGLTLVSVFLIIVFVGLIMLPFAIFILYSGYRMRKAYGREAASRVPVTVTVSDDAVTSGSNRLQLSSLREIRVANASDGPVADQIVVANNAAQAAGQNMRLALNAQQEFVSFQVTARIAEDSRPHLLVGGLTKETARALASDLQDEVKRRTTA